MNERKNLAFGRRNYVLMLVGIGVIALGLVIMTLDTEMYGHGFLGITLGPIILMIGFIIQFIAIFVKDRKNV